MTGASILDFIVSHCDKNSSDSAYRALALKWLNLVVKDIASKQDGFHWRFLEVLGATFNTAVADYDYAFATILPTTLIDTTKAIHVYEKTNDITMTFVPYEKFRQFVADETQDSGTSRYFSIFANYLLLYPIPSAIVAFYIDYVKLMSVITDSATVLDIPDKYEKVVIDGILEFAYQFDPELGSAGDQRIRYKDGLDTMIRENQQIIAENIIPFSHRVKSKLRNNVDGKNSIEFPLASDNM